MIILKDKFAHNQWKEINESMKGKDDFLSPPSIFSLVLFQQNLKSHLEFCT